jgi:xanthine dehydrogenase YagR molybdenum-binding subunit
MIDPAAPAPVGNMGQPIPRYDVRAKVTGKALYAADMALPDVAYAYLLSSRIAKGRIKSFDLKAARALPGVLDILTYQTIGDDIRKVSFFGGWSGFEFRRSAWLSRDRLGRPNDCGGAC